MKLSDRGKKITRDIACSTLWLVAAVSIFLALLILENEWTLLDWLPCVTPLALLATAWIVGGVLTLWFSINGVQPVFALFCAVVVVAVGLHQMSFSVGHIWFHSGRIFLLMLPLMIWLHGRSAASGDVSTHLKSKYLHVLPVVAVGIAHVYLIVNEHANYQMNEDIVTRIEIHRLNKGGDGEDLWAARTGLIWRRIVAQGTEKRLRGHLDPESFLELQIESVLNRTDLTDMQASSTAHARQA